MFSENTWMLYQQDLQGGQYYVKGQQGLDPGLPRFPIDDFAKYLWWPKVLAQIFENLQ